MCGTDSACGWEIWIQKCCDSLTNDFYRYAAMARHIHNSILLSFHQIRIDLVVRGGAKNAKVKSITQCAALAIVPHSQHSQLKMESSQNLFVIPKRASIS